MSVVRVVAANAPSTDDALTNKVFLNKADAATLAGESKADGDVRVQAYALMGDGRYIFTAESHPDMAKGKVGLGMVQRHALAVAVNDSTQLVPWTPPKSLGMRVFLQRLRLEVDFLSKRSRSQTEFDADKLGALVRRTFRNQFVVLPHQKMLVDGFGTKLVVVAIDHDSMVDEDASGSDVSSTPGGDTTGMPEGGIITGETQIELVRASGSDIKLTGEGSASSAAPSLFKAALSFEELGIGGLDNEFQAIFRRAFASRVFPQAVIKELGIKHVKGILLFGPPGTGKTLIARQLSKLLNVKDPKLVSGPEILNKYVGESERQVRELFGDAEQEYKERGDDSELHVIILDEIDAICKKRGSVRDGTGVSDSVVNQLLSKIDGVNALNNILVIGMTNRKEMIDEALLRNGRLEVHLEIALPDLEGREQIFRIHTRSMRDTKHMAENISIERLAKMTKNFSGAEIEGVVKSATSFALGRHIDMHEPGKPIDPKLVMVTWEDFERALDEVPASFGVSEDEFYNCAPSGIIPFGPSFDSVVHSIRTFVRQVREGERTKLMSVLIEGTGGSGRTAVATTMARESDFPFVKLVTPDNYVGWSESARAAAIADVFDKAYKSPQSAVVIDDLERLIDYTPIGPRFSNHVLQTIIALLRRVPPTGNRLLILATAQSARLLRDLGVADAFHARCSLPCIGSRDEFTEVLRGLSVFTESQAVEAGQVFDDGSALPIKRVIAMVDGAQAEFDGSNGRDSLVEAFKRAYKRFCAI